VSVTLGTARHYVGAMVEVVIDRPKGSRHPERGFEYPVNYGYLPGTRSGDGEEVDCYVLGVDAPVERFRGRCIAVLERHGQDDDKLVVVPDGASFSRADITALTAFQEVSFDLVGLTP
jgi:inorganic pyrophosphatase